jgi:hypothetical protein
MDRHAARGAAVAALVATGSYALVTGGAPDDFAGQSPVAVVTSKSIKLEIIARDLFEVTNGLVVSLYVRRDAGDEEATETLLDELALAAVLALHATGVFYVEQSDAFAEGSPNRIVDGVVYRVERIPLHVLSEGSD